MSKKPKFDPAIHDENPPWTAEDFAKALPASEMSDEMLAFFPKTRARLGRPPIEAPKVPVKLRFDARLVEALRASGPGWQTRINDLLVEKISRGKVQFGKKVSVKRAAVAGKTAAKRTIAKSVTGKTATGRKRA